MRTLIYAALLGWPAQAHAEDFETRLSGASIQLKAAARKLPPGRLRIASKTGARSPS